jgi:hypothetical protein
MIDYQDKIEVKLPTKPSVPMKANPPSPETIDYPAHYGGKDNPYEAIKIIRALNLGFSLGNTFKYIARAGKKGDRLEDLKKARWYLDEEIAYESDRSAKGKSSP